MTIEQWTPAPADRYVSVWPHTLGDFEKFRESVGTVRDGVLSIWRADERGRAIQGLPPVKVYAPGYWATYEHVGEYDPIAPEVPAAEQTAQLPRYRDPFQSLDPDELARTNGDVTPRAGTGAIVPYPKTEDEAQAPATAEKAEEGSEGATRRGVVERAPKAPAGDPPDTDEDRDGTDSRVTLAEFVFGPWAARIDPRSWRPAVRRLLARRRSSRPSSDPLLSVSAPLLSPVGWMALLVGVPLLALVPTLL